MCWDNEKRVWTPCALEGTTGHPKRLGDCRFCGDPHFEGLTHMCGTTATRSSWTVTTGTWTNFPTSQYNSQ